MKKQLILIGVVLLLVVVGLSGCEQQLSNTGNSEVQIVNNGMELTLGNYTYTNSDGTTTSTWGNVKRVYGTIKNIGNRTIPLVTVTVKFYGSDNRLLTTKTAIFRYMESGEYVGFDANFGENEPYYDQYDHYTVSVST